MSGAIVFFTVRSWFRIRGGLTGPLVFLGIMFLIEGSFWSALSDKGNIGSYDLNGLLFYAFVALTVSQLIACQGEPDSLSAKIEAGTLDSYLLRPRSVIMQLLGTQFGMAIARLSFTLPILLICVWRMGDVPFLNIVIAIPCLLAGALINAALNILIANLTFWFRESYAFVVVKETLFWMISGTMIPLDLFAEHWRNFLLHLPPSYTVYSPVQLLMGRATFLDVFSGQMATLAALIILSNLIFRLGVGRYQAFGS